MLLQALYEREPDLHSYAHEVTELAVAVGRRLGLGDGAIDEVQRAAMLHDIGKIARKHTVVGERIVSASPTLRRVGRIVRSSHERWDGTGYPDRLVGAEIPLAARIVFACDAFSAMTTSRAYREAMSVDEALRELDLGSASQFDPEVAGILVAVVHERFTVGAPD